MPLYVGETRVSRKNAFNRRSLTALVDAWAAIQPLLRNPWLEVSARIVLANWRGDAETRRFSNWEDLVRAIKLELGRRENYFFEQQGENLNIETVIFKTDVPTSSIGWTQVKFFEELGHPVNGRWFDERLSSRALSDMMQTDFIKEDLKSLAMVTQGQNGERSKSI